MSTLCFGDSEADSAEVANGKNRSADRISEATGHAARDGETQRRLVFRHLRNFNTSG